MKNHYQVLQVQRSASTKDIKNKTKELINNIKKSNISNEEKNKLNSKVYESYKFLTDYHKRKSLDEYLDSTYKIIQPKTTLSNSSSFFDDDDFGITLFSSIIPIDLTSLTNDKNSKSYFYSKSSTTSGSLDKNGNYITKTKEYTNDNGKKDKKEYSKTYNKGDLFDSINY